MSKSEIGSQSDDEFHDASESPTADPEDRNTHFIEELIESQKNLKVHDGTDDEDNEVYSTAATDPKVAPDTADDDIDEDKLREREKTMSNDELQSNKEKADQLKLSGNELFKNNSAEKSIEVYTEALHICPTTYPKERAVLYGNRAAAKIQIGSKKAAIEDCTKAIELCPEYVRAIMRRAKLNEQEDKLDNALEDYKRVFELDPSQAEARDAMIRLPPIINERNERMKEEMLSKLKDLGNMILKPFGLSTSNFQMQQDPSTGSYSVNFNQKSEN